MNDIPEEILEQYKYLYKNDLIDWESNIEDWFNKRRGLNQNKNLYTLKDIDALKSHISEYQDIERKAKENGVWLEMPDGSKWTGDPRAWVMMQSKAFLLNYSPQPWWNGESGEYVNTARFDNGSRWLSDDVGMGDYYAHVIDRSMLSKRFNKTSLTELLINLGILPKEAENYNFSILDEEIENPDKYLEGYNFLTAIPKKGNYRTAPQLPFSEGKGYFWTKLPYSFDGKNIIYNPNSKVKTDDVVEWSRQLGDDGIFINDVWDGETRDYYISNKKLSDAINMSRQLNRDVGFDLYTGKGVNEFISQPGFSRYLKFIEGNNGDFDINNEDKYAYQNYDNQNLYYAKQGMKLIPKKQYLRYNS